MPELPDIVVYIESLRARIQGSVLRDLRLSSPFLLRTVEPAVADLVGRSVKDLSRIGKRIVFEFDDDLFAVLHLMIAGRLRWHKAGAAIHKKLGLAAFDFDSGSLIVTEASKKKRASLHLVRGGVELASFDRGGIEVLDSSFADFQQTLARTNHTLKRALTDQSILSGIGNAYSDEILHRAKLSPFKQTQALTESEYVQLFDATVATLTYWTDHLRVAAAEKFPEKVTAFREGMAVHGRYGQACPVCGAPIQRIVYAQNEANYCANCQTGGKLLADRALSRLLKSNWPKTLEELEERKLS